MSHAAVPYLRASQALGALGLEKHSITLSVSCIHSLCHQVYTLCAIMCTLCVIRCTLCVIGCTLCVSGEHSVCHQVYTLCVIMCTLCVSSGVHLARKIAKLGMHSSDTAEIFFEDVRVPQTHLIGEEGRGFMYQMLQFQEERMFAALSGPLSWLTWSD